MKIIYTIALLGLLSTIQAGSIKCALPVYESIPIYKKVIKNIPHQECWEEEKVRPRHSRSSFSQLPETETVVSTRCIITKCKTVYEKIEETEIAGYRNYAKCDCKTISKISSQPLTYIDTTVTY